MTISKQLYANNAVTTLNGAINSVVTSIPVVGVTSFPTISGSGQFFLATLDDGVGGKEVIQVTGFNGSTLITSAVRGYEGSIAKSFPSGAKIELRLTAGTITQFAKSADVNTEVANLGLLDTPANSNGSVYICHSNDQNGTPILAVKDTVSKWKFFTHQIVKTTATTTSGTTTSIAASSANLSATILPTLSAGKYILQFTSGAYTGLCRVLTSVGSGTAAWSEALPGSPSNGDTFEVYISNSASLNTVVTTDFSTYVSTISPAFTGTPTTPTAAPGTNTTQLASTAFVTNAVLAASSGVVAAVVNPIQDGTVAIGVSNKYAREDHVHPLSVSYQTALGFTPPQQGTGVGQLANTVKLGWSAANRLKLTVDSTDYGNVVLDTQLANYVPLAGGSMTGPLTIYNSGMPTTGKLYLGSGGSRYIQYDGSQYVLPGANLSINGNQAAVLSANTFTGDQNLAGFKLTNAAISGGRFIKSTGNIASNIATLDTSSGFVDLTLSSFITSFVFNNVVASSTISQSFILNLISNGSGSSIVWPAGDGVTTLKVLWAQTPPESPAVIGQSILVRLDSLGPLTWQASIIGTGSRKYAVLSNTIGYNLYKSRRTPGGYLGIYRSPDFNISKAYSDMYKTSGRWYWEVTIGNSSYMNTIYVGVEVVGSTSPTTGLGLAPQSWCYAAASGYKVNNSTGLAFGSPANVGDVIGVYLNCEEGEIRFSVNGGGSNSIAYSITPGLAYQPCVSIGSELYFPMDLIVNFGATPFRTLPQLVDYRYNEGLYDV